MTDMSGKFTYNSLRQTLKDNGVQTKDLSSALKKVASDNNIDDIENLDKSQSVKIAESIFNNSLGSTNPMNVFSNDVIGNNNFFNLNANMSVDAISQPLPFLINPESSIGQAALDRIAGDGEEVIMPEVYNDDDYEVVEYDDFYAFNSADSKDETNEETENTQKQASNHQEIDFDEFKNQYANTILQGADKRINQDEVLKNMFDMMDANSNELLDKTELSAAFYSAALNQQKLSNDETVIPDTEGEGMLGNGMMDMDMSNDSFNPQG